MKQLATKRTVNYSHGRQEKTQNEPQLYNRKAEWCTEISPTSDIPSPSKDSGEARSTGGSAEQQAAPTVLQ